MKFDHNNISPLDSRYAKKISDFRENFSESELIKIRFEIEIEWILFLCSKLPNTFKPLSKKSVEKEFISMASISSWVYEEDIGYMCSFLISDDAKRISGQVIGVDGNATRLD